jgi:hypothetical protein
MEQGEVQVRRYQVDICDPCMKLEGSECHTPGCIFWLCTMGEVQEYLNRMLLRPLIDGEPAYTTEDALSAGQKL